jgi:hypothetical protein
MEENLSFKQTTTLTILGAFVPVVTLTSKILDSFLGSKLSEIERFQIFDHSSGQNSTGKIFHQVTR